MDASMSAFLNMMAVSGNMRSGVLPTDMENAAKRLSQADFDDYKRRLGENSPTPADAMMFSTVSMKLSKKLSPSTMKKYNDAVLKFKKKDDDADVDGKAVAESIIVEIERQALSEDPKVVTKMADASIKRSLFRNHGQRVRLKEGHRCGTVSRPDMTKFLLANGESGAHLDILFDDISGEEATKVHECDLQLLCSVSGCNKHGHLMCARCKQRMFCSVDCQKIDWAEWHKKVCKKYVG